MISRNPFDAAEVFRRLRLKSQQILLLTALDQHRNLRRAAREIHLTQPAASGLLQQMERGLGVLLFERHARGMKPTAHGEIMIRYARATLHTFSHARDEMTAIQSGATGLVRIGSVMGAVPGLLIPAINRYKTSHPRVQLTVRVDTSDLLIPALLRGELDAVLGRIPDHSANDDLDIELLESEIMSIVARPGHPLFGRARLKFSNLCGYTWILHPAGSPIRWRIEQSMVDAGIFSSQAILETASILATTALLESTDMLSVVPRDVANYYRNRGMLSILPLKLPISMSKLSIVTHRINERSPAVQSFIKTLGERRTGTGRRKPEKIRRDTR